MSEPTKADLTERLAEAQAELADRRPGVIVALHGVLADMPDIDRRRVQGFKAFNVDDVYATIRPLFIRHGLVVVPRVREVTYGEGVFAKGTAYTDARIVVDYVITAVSDGTEITMTGAAEGRDTQDKATNKAIQQAYKYVLIQTLLINTGEDAEEDPGDGDHPVKTPAPAPAPVPEISAEDIAVKLTNAARSAVYKLVGEDKEEAKTAWPLVLGVAGVTEIKTKKDRDLVIDAATQMFADPDDDQPPGGGYDI